MRDLQGRWAEASEQRAVYADKALQIRNLTDRIKVMEEGQDRYAYLLSPTGKCDKAETFYRLTRPACEEGRITKCSEDDIIRYLERVDIYPDRITVTFKAGIAVEIERAE